MKSLYFYFSENYADADNRFREDAAKYGQIKDYMVGKTNRKIPVITFGHGPNKFVINTGVHGIEGYAGSAFLRKFMTEHSEFLKQISDSSTVSLSFVHAVNAFGMENFTRGVEQDNIDLNRNFIVDWEKFSPTPNTIYAQNHDLLVSNPATHDKWLKAAQKTNLDLKTQVCDLNNMTLGQYEFPNGLFYGGRGPADENIALTKIYDDLMVGATSLHTIGIHTGAGPNMVAPLLVSHPKNHEKTDEFRKTFPEQSSILISPCSDYYKPLPGDFVDYVEHRYQNVPVYSADLELGTGTSRFQKDTANGDSIYEIVHFGQLSPQTKAKMRASFYPDDYNWMNAAMLHAESFIENLKIKILSVK